MRTLFLILIFTSSIRAQSFYECKWSQDGIKYDGLLVFFADNDAFMRVRYYYEDNSFLAEYNCKGQNFATTDETYYFLDGYDAKVLNSLKGQYVADNILIKNSSSGFGKTAFVIDDNTMETNNAWYNFLKPVDEFREVNPRTTFNETYLNRFFLPSEYFYQALSKYVKPVIVTPATSSQTLHLCLAANTESTDHIAWSCRQDSINVIREFSQIAKELGYRFSLVTVSGQKFSKNNTLSALNDIKSGPNDIFVFVYTGHGYRWSDQQQELPNLDFRVDPKGGTPSEGTMINLEQIARLVHDKGPRFGLVMGDCCNNPYPKVAAKGMSLYGTKSMGSGRDLSQLSRLFSERKGTLILNAASPGEIACGLDDGGILLNGFFALLGKSTSYMNRAECNWDSILRKIFELSAYKSSTYCNFTQNGSYKWLQ